MATKIIAELNTSFVFATASDKVQKVTRELCDIFELRDTRRPRKRKVITVEIWDQIDELIEKADDDIRFSQYGDNFLYEYWNGHCYHTLVSVIQFRGC